MNLHRYMTTICTTQYTIPEVDRVWPAYLIQSESFLTRLIFSNEKDCLY